MTSAHPTKKDPAVTASKDIYVRLAEHLSMTGMPLTEALVDLVSQAWDPEEARIALLLKPYQTPLTAECLTTLSDRSGLPEQEISGILDRMVEKKLIFCIPAAGPDGQKKAYALHHAGFGFPQSFFWSGDTSDTAKQMSRLVGKYFNRDTTQKAFGGTATKPYRYVPVHKSIDPGQQAVLPHDLMKTVIDSAGSIAVTHCPCRVQAQIWGRPCPHTKEVCLKFDEMARYVIARGIGRRIDRQEAGQIIAAAADEGLVHFVDNAAAGIKHNCNCCGCACWNVGSIRRRKIPRDVLMAVYYLRRTDTDACIECGRCADICPVAAVSTDDGIQVDENWCIGCGVCTRKCPADAVTMVPRSGRGEVPESFAALYDRIAAERRKADT